MSQAPTLPPKPQQSQYQPVTVPESFKRIPTNELQRLTDSISELRGYLLQQPDANMDSTVEELSQVVNQMKEYIEKLEELNSRKEETNKKLKDLDGIHAKWQSIQSEMMRLLDEKFSIETLYQSLSQLVNESKQITESLSQSFIFSSEKHTDASIENFISTYKTQRSLYHLRDSKLQRFKENRIGGLYL